MRIIWSKGATRKTGTAKDKTKGKEVTSAGTGIIMEEETYQQYAEKIDTSEPHMTTIHMKEGKEGGENKERSKKREKTTDIIKKTAPISFYGPQNTEKKN